MATVVDFANTTACATTTATTIDVTVINTTASATVEASYNVIHCLRYNS